MKNATKFPRRNLLKSMLVIPFAASWSTGAYAQDFPTRPIRLIAPYSAGGSTDFLARTVANSMSNILGQPVVVENRPGAGGMLAGDMTAKSPADGYTFMLTAAGIMTINQSIYKKMPFDPLKDLAPLTIAVRLPLVIAVHPSNSIKSVKDLLTLSLAEPGKLSYGSAGNGTSQHLAGEMFKVMGKVEILHVPYKGGAPAMNDLLGNQISMMFVQTPSALPQVKAGKIRIVAIGSPERSPQLPDVPTIAESGLPGYNSDTWYGFAMPAGVPPAIGKKLHAAIMVALKENKVRLEDAGFVIDGGSQKAMEDTMKSEALMWAEVIRSAKIETQ
jgi:tripartite-type tricarboxylate transporter receptor subunit TctC